jgi:AraC-like DNA-binding protein
VLLPMGRATVEQVAQKLGVNVRTLQRQLEADGATFSALINSVRRELALRYVQSGQHSLGHVAELLGYSTQTSFTRWFKSEFGVAPREWQPDGTTQPPQA